MIRLHRITHPDHPVYINPDLIQTVEAHPDTVIALTNATKFVVAETPDEVVELIRSWRSSILGRALEARPDAAPAQVAEVVELTSRSGAGGHS